MPYERFKSQTLFFSTELTDVFGGSVQKKPETQAQLFVAGCNTSSNCPVASKKTKSSNLVKKSIKSRYFPLPH